jgi:hypothetical protein
MTSRRGGDGDREHTEQAGAARTNGMASPSSCASSRWHTACQSPPQVTLVCNHPIAAPPPLGMIEIRLAVVDDLREKDMCCLKKFNLLIENKISWEPFV